MSNVSLSKQEFAKLQGFVNSTLGIWLTEQKMPMVEQRILPMVVGGGFHSFSEFFDQKLRRPQPKDLSDFFDRITTNHTYFARESEHFDYLSEQVLPEIVERRKVSGRREVRMWCAAASRGHEPYTLAMILRRFFGADYQRWNAGLLATDISRRSLETAMRGHYPAEEVSQLPSEMVSKFFQRVGDEEMEVAADLKQDVLYRRFNLMDQRYPFKRPFDVVFCRNVLIYFSPETKDEVVRKIASHLVPGGYLFVGQAESLNRDIQELRHLQPGVYVKLGADGV